MTNPGPASAPQSTRTLLLGIWGRLSRRRRIQLGLLLVVMNLLRRGGYRSIRRGLRTLAHDIKGMLVLGGVQAAENST